MGLHLNWDLRLDPSCAEARVDALLLELLGFARERTRSFSALCLAAEPLRGAWCPTDRLRSSSLSCQRRRAVRGCDAISSAHDRDMATST